MIRPTKHSHPDKTVIILSMLLIKRLKKYRIESYSDLYDFSKKVDGGGILFLPALNFLFLLGLIEYRPKTDSLEYINKDEAI